MSPKYTETGGRQTFLTEASSFSVICLALDVLGLHELFLEPEQRKYVCLFFLVLISFKQDVFPFFVFCFFFFAR